MRRSSGSGRPSVSRAYVVWVSGLAVYVLAVLHRSSLGVSGLEAADRFEIDAAGLGAFAVVQLAVYAALQIPVGIALDRYGSKAILSVGLVLMTVGQLGFALFASFSLALLARGTTAAGDAMIFVGVLRLVGLWFRASRAHSLVQLTGQVGALGALLATAPMVWALQVLGWSGTYLATAGLGLVVAGILALGVGEPNEDEGPPWRRHGDAPTSSLRSVWGNAWTRLAMWTHFTVQFSPTVFCLVWGYPFLVQGQELSPQDAGALLMVATAWVVIGGLLISWFVRRAPARRLQLVMVVVVLISAAWVVVLSRPEPSPLWMLVCLVCVLATGGPASIVSFDLARRATSHATLGRTNAVVQSGGYLASLMAAALIGAVLEWREPGGIDRADLLDFRVALTVQFLILGAGALQVARYRRKVRGSSGARTQPPVSETTLSRI